MGEKAGGIGAMGMSIPRFVINREAVVNASEGLKVSGKIIAIQESQTRPDHKPCMLVLQISQGLCLVRDWTLIIFGGEL